MDKLTMAHQWYMKHGKDNYMEKSVECAWQYADAMQAEADKRKEKGLPDALKPEVDWDLAPPEATTWKTVNNVAIWIAAHGQPLCTAPTFGFTGTHLIKRPQ